MKQMGSEEERSGDHPDPKRRQGTHRRCESLGGSHGGEVGRNSAANTTWGKIEWSMAIFINSRAYEENYLECEF